ncbi:DUF5082 domain-containing protein [Virgibacillus dakarensis]|uniref:YwqH-like family protein n=1 Tax=Virgibacillus dakarensis TaxID=1917889 RepID=UPI000B446E19|nr:DUF5082 family protein [Virgibacillus dakarensis]MTW86062.1 DUF5082 domain-containing protein [Virgibacillus dakarensis]
MSELSTLKAQKRSVEAGISNSNNQIALLEDKISRLQEASGELGKNISELGKIKKSIDGLTIDENSWQGKKEDQFEKNYQWYKTSVVNFISKTEDAQTTMEEDITRYQGTIDSYENGLKTLRSTLSSLESQISAAEAAKKE